MSSKKTTLTIRDVQTLLNEYFTSRVSNIQHLVEGEESQAFWFAYHGKEFVIRINRLIDGFYKDAYAYQHFASKVLPIPEVIVIRQFVDRANGMQLTFCEKHLSALPHYHTRLKCYQLRIALDELYDNILHPNIFEIEWCIQSTREILQTY